MLRRLEELLQEPGRLWQVEDLARALGTTPGMVRAMLHTLQRQGRVRQVALGCSPGAACWSCPLSGVCVRMGKSLVWLPAHDGGTRPADGA